jgi:hypothetical protein
MFFFFFRVLPLLSSPNPTPLSHAGNGNGHIAPLFPEAKPSSSHKGGRLLKFTLEVPHEFASMRGGFTIIMSAGDVRGGGEPSAQHDLPPLAHRGGRTRGAHPPGLQGTQA